MDRIINEIMEDIREIEMHPVDAIALIGVSIYCHFETILKIDPQTRNTERRIVEFGKQVKMMLNHLIKPKQEINEPVKITLTGRFVDVPIETEEEIEEF